jgi:hypothetical protein
VAILLDAVDATAADKDGVVVARHAEVNAAELIWFDSATTEQKAVALAQLKTLDIIAR